MIAAGVLILLFVAYQLWGTGLRTAAAQNQLREQFQQLQEQARSTTTLPALDETSSTTGVDPNAPAPTIAPPTVAGEIPPPKPNDPLGIIRIDKLGVDFQYVEGVALGFLEKGPGHFPSTPFPGQAGNAALAGHRTTFAAPFNRIDELVPGDQITVETLQGTFTYEVRAPAGAPEGEQIGHRIITPTQVEILDQPTEAGTNTLTLMACHPKYSAAQRIVVVADLVGNPAPTTAKSAESQAAAEAGENAFADSEGLAGGDPEARNHAIGWSIVAAAVWLAVFVLARRWSWRQPGKWLLYGAGVVVFAVPLFLAFEAINQLLPAGY
jgi:sortase A